MSDPSTFKRMEEAKKRREAIAKKEEKFNNRQQQYQQPQYQQPQFQQYQQRVKMVRESLHFLILQDYTRDRDLGAQYTSFEQRQPQRTPPKSKSTAVKSPAAKKMPSTDYAKVAPMSEAPSEMAVETMTLHADELVCFHGDKHWMSTFYPAEITIEGHAYPSAEHYYQACKLYMLADPSKAGHISKITVRRAFPRANRTVTQNPLQAKVATRKLLRKHGVTNEQLDEWKMSSGPTVIRHAQLHKFMQHADLCKKLLATDDALLAHVYEGDKVYGCGMKEAPLKQWMLKHDKETITLPTTLETSTLPYFPLLGGGKNLLGMIMMRVRVDCRLLARAKETGEALPDGDDTLSAAFKCCRLIVKAEEEAEEGEDALIDLEALKEPKVVIKEEK